MNVTSNGTPRLRGTLGKLRRDRAGNAFAMLGIGILPLAGLVGGAVDMSRLYLTKTRLQQACDAGALAGRKVMGGGTWTADGNAAKTAAEKFFDGNFKSGDYGTSDGTRTYTEAAGKVTGTASAKVPMTLMKIFKRGTETISVTCSTEMRLPNTDVMFVLDTTGSMNCPISNPGCNNSYENPGAKIQGMRTAVKCFYEIVARLDTNADCDAGAPSGGTGDQVQVRFGFVPFATNVNVGRLLPSNWFADSWTYQSREQTTVYGRVTSYTDGSWSTSAWEEYDTTTQNSSSACAAEMPADTTAEPKAAPTLANNSWTNTTWRASQPFAYKDFRYVYSNSTKVCRIDTRDVGFIRTNYYALTNDTSEQPFKSWRYKPVTFDVSPLKNGTGWNNSLTLPTGPNWTNQNVVWDGCIEERQTTRRTNYSPIDSIKDQAIDLDIDRVPDSNDATKWGPALGAIIYPRKADYRNNSSWSENEITTFTNYTGESYACSNEARKMQKWPSASTFDDYVDDFVGSGNTYHDIGLLWGARLLSPTGLFRAENEFTPKGGEIERHLIFMTDGDACTALSNYQAYGLGWYDRRQTDPAVVPTAGCTTTGTLTQQVNARTAAICEAAKNKNLTLWVIWFGEENPYLEGAMTACASPDRFFSARNSSELQQTFQRIANQISQLRLTQ